MISRLSAARILTCWAVVLLAVCAVSAQSQKGTMKLQVQLVWGTDDPQSPNPKHKPVGPELRDKLKRLPLKWKHYFEETSRTFEVSQGGSQKVSLSERCDIEVRNLDGMKVELSHFGKGKKVATRTQALPKSELLVLGGNAPDFTAWLVVVQRVE